MGIGAITLDAAGAVTAPTAYPLALSTALGVATHEYPFTFARFSRIRSLVLFNGRGPLQHLVTNFASGSITLYRLGGLAPYAALTAGATGSGARSAATYTPGGQPADQTYVVICSAGDQTNHEWRVYFVTSFITTGGSALLDYWQVKRGANEAAALDNLKLAINGTGTDGSEYRSPTNHPGEQTVHHPRAWSDWVTAETNTNTTQVIQAVAYGTGGNVYEANAGTAGGTFGTSSLMTGGAPFTGTAPDAGRRQYALAYKRTPDEMTTGMSPAVTLEKLDDGNVALSVLADPPASQAEGIDAKTWLRTLDGGDVFHEGYDVVVADTTDTDDIEDATIADAPEADPFRRLYADGFPPRYRMVAEKDGRLFGAGFLAAKDFSVGTADVEFGRIYATLSSAAHPTRAMEGRSFVVTTSAVTAADIYTIVMVEEGASRRLHLDRPYEGTTTGTAAYAVRDTRNPFEVGYSEPQDFHTWPADNVLEGIHGPTPEGITALASVFGVLVAFTRTGIWTLRGETPDTYAFFHEYEGVGCVGPLAWCVAEGRLWFLGDDGIYAWSGPQSGEPYKVSSPPVKGRGMPSGVGGTVERINATYAHLAVAHFEPTRRVVRLFLPLDDDSTNRYALVFDLQTRMWALDHYGIDITYVATLPDPSGSLHTIAGDLQGDPWELDISNSDGAYGFEPKNAITASTRLTVTCGGAAFPTTGDALKGIPVTFVDASGNFTYNTIASNTATVLTLARIESTAPTGTAYVGAIHGIIETGRFAWGDPSRAKVLAYARVAFSPQDDGQFFFSFTFNQGDATVGSDADGDLALTDGEEQFWVRQNGKLLRWRIDVLEPGCDPAFLGVMLDVPRRQALAVG